MVTSSYARLRRPRRRRQPKRRLYQRIWNSGAAEERRRIGRDLHDTVIQTLYSANLSVTTLASLHEQAPEDEQESLEKLGELIQRALDETRILLLELQSPLASEGSIGELLQYLAGAFTERTRVPVTMQMEGENLFLPKIQITVAQIVREMFNNIAKHAEASEVSLMLQYERTGGKVVVSDNGRGFDPSDVRAGSFGLEIMRERAESINARLSITSEPGKGTEVTVIWGSYAKRNAGLQAGSAPNQCSYNS